MPTLQRRLITLALLLLLVFQASTLTWSERQLTLGVLPTTTEILVGKVSTLTALMLVDQFASITVLVSLLNKPKSGGELMMAGKERLILNGLIKALTSALVYEC